MAIVRDFADVDPKDALVIVAFPSTGAASPIAGQYLARTLEMPLVGDILSDGMQGIVHIEDGRPTSPIRIHGGDVACEVDGPCRRIYLIGTEVPLPGEVALDIMAEILAWAKDARLILALDAIVRDAGDDTPDVYRVGTGQRAQDALAATDVGPLKAAMMTGTSALLLTAKQEGPPVGALVVEARRGHPDGRAAAALVKALDPLIPQIKVDIEPLLRDAMALEKEIGSRMKEATQSKPARASHTFI